MTSSGYAVLLCSIVWAGAATSAEPRTEHTFKLEAGENRPAANLDDAGFLVGSWTGTAFGQQFEEVWNAPSAGSMIGLFKLYDGEEVSFYELLLMTVEEGSLSLRVKHFNADFSAWEEKEEFVDFRLVRIGEGELHFQGLSFYRQDENRIDGYIVMHSNDEVKEHHLVYERKQQ